MWPYRRVENYGYSTQSGLYSVEFSVSPETSGADTLVALSQGPQTNWRNLAAIVRFNTDNTIDVRDGDVYRADTVMTYDPARWYYVRMEVNVYAHTYSVFVRPGVYEYYATGGTQIAKDYAFRTEQQGVTALDNVIFEAEVGSLHGCAEATKPMLGPVPGGPAQMAKRQAAFVNDSSVGEFRCGAVDRKRGHLARTDAGAADQLGESAGNRSLQ